MLQPRLNRCLMMIMRMPREHTEPKHTDIKVHRVTSEQRITEMAFADREHPHSPIIHSVPVLSPHLSFSSTLIPFLSLTLKHTLSRVSQVSRNGVDDLKLK